MWKRENENEGRRDKGKVGGGKREGPLFEFF